MRYQRLTDDTSIIVGENGESQVVSSLNANRKICHTRKLILILLFIQVIFCVICLGGVIRLLINNIDDNHQQGIRSLPAICISIVYYGCSLLVIYRFHQFGIYVFAWMGLLQYISICLEAFLNIVFIFKHPSYDKTIKTGFYISLIITILSTFQAILIVITLKFTFKLIKLIKIFKRDVLAQM